MAFPVTAPGALLPLDAPLPQPRRYTLLDAARSVTPEEDRWLAGGWINGYPSGRPFTHDPCSTGTYRFKSAEPTDAMPMAGTFTVVVGGTCTARSIGPNLSIYEDRLRLAFLAVESEAVERALIAGDGSSEEHVGDPNIEILASGAAQTPLEGLALLEDEIASVGNGMIHVAPATATAWVSLYLIEAGRDNKMRTQLGTIVSVGAGYRGTHPDSTAAPAAGNEWAFATGFVDYRRDLTPTVLPGSYSQALDRSSNEVAIYAERNYLLSWVGRQDTNDESHIQAGVLIDRTP